MELIQQTKPFNHTEWLFEVKHDGFRSLAYIDGGTCKLVSRNEFDYTRFNDVAKDLRSNRDMVLDGELVCLDDEGKTLFYDLMFNRKTVYLYAFDILSLGGKDLKDLPLIERKEILEEVVTELESDRLLYIDFIPVKGEESFQLVCAGDMEGIVAKPKQSPYRLLKGKTPWIKIKNRDYSQAKGRSKIFNQRH